MCEHCRKPLVDEPIRRSWVGPPMPDNSVARGTPYLTGYAPADLRWDAVIVNSAKAAIRGWIRP